MADEGQSQKSLNILFQVRVSGLSSFGCGNEYKRIENAVIIAAAYLV